MAVMGMRSILSLYNQIVSGKNFTESIYTIALTARDRSGARPEPLLTAQFLVELRMAVLPTVRELWESELTEKAPSEVSEKLIDVIKSITTADGESGALKRTDLPFPPLKPHRKTFKVNEEYLATLTDRLFDRDLAQEALYRCNNSLTLAEDYGREAQMENRPRYPVPEGDIIEPTKSSRPSTGTSTGSGTPDHSDARMHTIEYMRTARVRPPPSESPEDTPPTLPLPSGLDSTLADVPSLIDSISQHMPAPTGNGGQPATAQSFDFSAILDQVQNSRATSTPAQASSSSVPLEPFPIKHGKFSLEIHGSKLIALFQSL